MLTFQRLSITSTETEESIVGSSIVSQSSETRKFLEILLEKLFTVIVYYFPIDFLVMRKKRYTFFFLSVCLSKCIDK